MKISKGFSLIEIVVVLLLLGLVSGIAIPRLTKLVNTLQTQNQINDIRNTVQAAPLYAYINGQDIDLSNYLINSDVMPANWKLVLPEPVKIKSNGICLGGTMKIFIEDSVREYQVLPPFCQVEDA